MDYKYLCPKSFFLNAYENIAKFASFLLLLMFNIVQREDANKEKMGSKNSKSIVS